MQNSSQAKLPPSEADIRNALRQVIDPEAGLNIVDLGLVYRIHLTGDTLLVEMTMTSPACPMGDMLMEEVKAALNKVVSSSTQLDIRLVWSPPWDASLMSEDARAHFGW